eukprot:7224742-Pyramimonas_sp.AAC.2
MDLIVPESVKVTGRRREGPQRAGCGPVGKAQTKADMLTLVRCISGPAASVYADSAFPHAHSS